MGGALAGITVLEMTTGMSGALAAMFLCDNGARVIRIDRPGSTLRGQPSYRVWDRGKESVLLYLDSTEGGEDLDGLIARADALIEGPDARSDYTRLAALNPRLVHCVITGFGTDGPLRNHPAFEELAQAGTGVLANLPSFERGPAHLAYPVASVSAALLAATGAVAALFAREKTGRGRRVDTSLLAGALASFPLVAGGRLQPAGPRPSPPGDSPFYGLHRCADGEWIQLACAHAGFTSRAIEVLGIADRIVDERFNKGLPPHPPEVNSELVAIVSEAIAGRPCSEWESLFEAADVPFARAGTVEQAKSNPQVLFNEMLIDVDDPELGPMRQMGLAVGLLGTPGEVKGPAPALGQHTGQILKELGSETPTESRPARDPPAQEDPPPLDGVRVLEIANVIAGPNTGRLLADMGAEVVKLEPPQGDISRPGGSPKFYYYSINKRSVCVDAKDPKGREVVQRLAARADVFVENMRPGASDRVGVGQADLDRLNPDIVHTHITAFGTQGPYAHRPGMDPLAQALTGLQRLQGGRHTPPVFLGALGPTDHVASMLATFGTVMALLVRARGGSGQTVESNLLNAGVLLGSDEFTEYHRKPRPPAIDGAYGPHALHRMYEASDGWIYLIAETPRERKALANALGRKDLATEGPSDENADATLAGELSDIFSTRRAKDWTAELEAAGVPCASVAEDYEADFFSDPQALDSGMVQENRHPVDGDLKFSGNLIRFRNTRAPRRRHTPLLGEHSSEVLAEAGYSDSEIAALYESSVLKTEALPHHRPLPIMLARAERGI
ncbi:MAG: CoA transferase [Chloroflexi bacterium]|nr:CoA transferase [Chloroflexota bacterium]